MNEIEIIDGEPRIGSVTIAGALSRPHDHVRKIIEKHRNEFESFGCMAYRFLDSTGGRPLKEHMLSYNQFIFFMSILKNTSKITEATSLIIKAGSLMEAIRLIKNFDFDGSDQRYVYAAIDKVGRIKIGISNDPERRLAELNIGNADELKLVFTKEAKGEGYSDEIKMHNACGEFRIRSEWFEPGAAKVLSKQLMIEEAQENG